MVPGKYNIVCPQGTTLMQQLTYSENGTPVNLFGYTARMQVREITKSANVMLSLTTENGGIVLGGSAGTINLIASAAATTAMYAKEYVYDIELVSASGTVYRIIEGKFIVTPEVTR